MSPDIQIIDFIKLGFKIFKRHHLINEAIHLYNEIKKINLSFLELAKIEKRIGLLFLDNVIHTLALATLRIFQYTHKKVHQLL